MITKIFGVYDSKAMAFLQPFFSESVGAAVRAFGDAVNEGNSPLSKHPGDYQLYELGSIDTESGLLTPLVPTRLLGNGLDFKDVVPKAPVVYDRFVKESIDKKVEVGSDGS